MLDLRSVSVVAVRSLAILFGVSAISIVPAAVITLRHGPDPGESYSTGEIGLLTAAALYLVVSAILFIFAKQVGRLLMRGLETSTIQVDEDSLRILQSVAFSLLGAYMLVYSIPALIEMIAVAVIPASRDEHAMFVNFARGGIPVGDAIRELLKTGLGVWLLLGRNRLVGSLRKFWKRTLSSGDGE